MKYIQSHIMPLQAGDNDNGSSKGIDIGIRSLNNFPDLTLAKDLNTESDDNKESQNQDGLGLSFGVSVMNLGSGIPYFKGAKADPLPTILRIAAGYTAIQKRECEMRITLDAVKFLVDEKETIWHFGIESNFYGLFALRAGNKYDKAGHTRYWAAGAGLGPSWLHADFSYIFKSDEAGNRNGGEYGISIACNISPNAFR